MVKEGDLYQQYPSWKYRNFYRKEQGGKTWTREFNTWFYRYYRKLSGFYRKEYDFDRFLFMAWAMERYYYFRFNRYRQELHGEIASMVKILVNPHVTPADSKDHGTTNREAE
ncbi:MAG: hypothetical protein HQK83_13385 [Fibrobacteria bacterium]|nr:hypothetical protein [Fibrobacteria bacterium]